nr:EscU/YscU/HrcU family type III secretion system export apparatus switch protein [Spirochaetota bacterium]
VIIGLCSYLIILNEFDTVLSTPDISIAASLKDVLFIAFKILIWSLVLLIVMAIPDYLFQKREFIESIKMSKQDIKQEMKETVGDPHVKARLKEMQRQILTRSMIKNVPKADVVVTNPTHFAVALKWDREKNNSAPAVVAKGVDYIALKIREIAKGNDVMIIENRPLAQEMYKRLEVGDIIPADLYSAVVELYRILYENGKLKDAM